MDPRLQLAVIAQLAFFGRLIAFVEALKHAKNGGLKHSPEDARAVRLKAWFGYFATMCAFGQLVMFGWLLLIVQQLLIQPR